jgi:hypothetical protein
MSRLSIREASSLSSGASDDIVARTQPGVSRDCCHDQGVVAIPKPTTECVSTRTPGDHAAGPAAILAPVCVESHAERADTNVLPTRGAIVFAVLGVE